MYIIKNEEGYTLSEKRTESAYCKVLAPAIVVDGALKRAKLTASNEHVQTGSIERLTIKDEIRNNGNGIFKVVRSIKNENSFCVRFKSVFEADTIFKPEHFVFPGFHYDTSHCDNKVDMGEIVCGWTKQMDTLVSNTPTGLEKDGQPWVFAYDREGIPSASISEDESHVFAMFVSDENPVSLESSCSMIKKDDGTYRHRIIHPVSEMPYTYAQKNAFEPPMETYFSLEGGEAVVLSMYLFVGVPKYKYYGTANVMEACTKVFPFHKKPALSQKKVWDVGISYTRFLLKDVDGVPMFSPGLCDKLFYKCHSALLKGEELKKAMEDPENWKLTVFADSYEIGWAGQCALTARLFALNGYKNGYEMDVKIAESCLDAYVSIQEENGLLYTRYGEYIRLPEEERRLPDACNIGWAMCELMRSYRMFKEHGKVKQNYYEFSVKIAEFAVKNFHAEYGFAKTWNIDGTPVSTAGSVGGFMIMGLCEVHRETKDQRYLDTIIKAMDFYYTRDIDHFICVAGALDCACIDKETVYPFLEAALYLYELTGEELWLERAQKAAYYFFSWMMFYDCIYDSDADFSKYGYHTTGGTLISAEHSALDAWGALVVDAMFKLWHITGNENFKTWARMTWWNALLCIATEDTPEIHGNKRPVGSQNEGFFHCRWTKYRPTCEERGHMNENLRSWMGAWRLYTLATMRQEDLELLWEGKEEKGE